MYRFGNCLCKQKAQTAHKDAFTHPNQFPADDLDILFCFADFLKFLVPVCKTVCGFFFVIPLILQNFLSQQQRAVDSLPIVAADHHNDNISGWPRGVFEGMLPEVCQFTC